MSLEALHHFVYLLNIPLQLFTGVMATRVTLRFLEPGKGWWNIALLFIVHYCTMNALVFIGDYWPPLLMAPGFIAAVCVFCRGRLLARFSMGMILVLLPLSINALLTNLRPPFDFLFHVNIAFLWCGILLFVRKVLPDGARPPIRSARLWALMDLLALMPFGAAITVIALTDEVYTYTDPDPFNDIIYIQNERALRIILVLAAIGALALLVAVVVMARHERLEEEQVLWRMRSQYFENVEQAQHRISILRHDMANHLAAMSGLDDAGMRKYLENLIASPAMNAGRRFCENEVANAVLANKAPVIEEARIDSSIDVRIPNGIPINDIDLCALFANSLDNAIEANLKLPPEQRLLRLRAVMENGFLVTELMNNYTGEINLEDGQISTSKEDKPQHGFGLQGMREIAERYGGSCKTQYTKSSFRLLIVIPVSM